MDERARQLLLPGFCFVHPNLTQNENRLMLGTQVDARPSGQNDVKAKDRSFMSHCVSKLRAAGTWT